MVSQNPDGPGCAAVLFALACAALVLVMFMGAVHWTSIEDGCLVERRFKSGWNWDSTIVERLCPDRIR